MENNTEKPVVPSWKDSTLWQKIAKVIFVLVSVSVLILGGSMVFCGGTFLFFGGYFGGMSELALGSIAGGIVLLFLVFYFSKRVFIKKNLHPGKFLLIFGGIIISILIFLLLTGEILI